MDSFDYIERNGGACICRCYGEGGYLELPEEIEGLKVTALADHVFAREPSFLLRSVPWRRAVREKESGIWREIQGEEQRQITREPKETPQAQRKDDGEQVTEAQRLERKQQDRCLRPICGEDLREIILPLTLREIGNYAFYGCHRLERVSVPAQLKSLGSGAFVDCNHVRELVVVLEGQMDRLPALRQLLAEISYEVEVAVRSVTGGELLRLHYPEYYEDAVENTPARIFEMKFEGTGFKYRQCFRDEKLDLPRYDSLFYEASVQEFPPTVLRMIFDRLFFPAELKEEARQQYTDYILADIGRLLDWCLPGKRTALKGAALKEIVREEAETPGGPDALEIMSYLCREALLDAQMLEKCLQRAMEAGRADVVSLLTDYRRTRSARPRVRERYKL